MNNWQQAAMKYMQDNVEDNRDKITGEVNATKLAEDCFRFCPCFKGQESILRWVEHDLLEIAFAVIEQDRWLDNGGIV